MVRNSIGYRSVAFRTWNVGEAALVFGLADSGTSSGESKQSNSKSTKFNNLNPTSYTSSTDSTYFSSTILEENPNTKCAVEVRKQRKLTKRDAQKSIINRYSINYSYDDLTRLTNFSNSFTKDMDLKQMRISNIQKKSEPELEFMPLRKNQTKLTNSKFYLNQNGDFYSSNEYVKYSNQNIYENVIAESKLHEQTFLNRSVDALNDEFNKCSSSFKNLETCKLPIKTAGVRRQSSSSTGSSTTFGITVPYIRPSNGTLTPNLINKINGNQNSFNDSKANSLKSTTNSHITSSASCKLKRRPLYIIDSKLSSPNVFGSVKAACRSSTKSANKNQCQTANTEWNTNGGRTKSLDNVTSVMPSARKNSRVLKAEKLLKSLGPTPAINTSMMSTSITSTTSTGTIQSAKNFLRKLSSFSRFRNTPTTPQATNSPLNNTNEDFSKMTKTSNQETFQCATSPFFEIRLPEPEERPFLPYNIHYQVEDDDLESAKTSIFPHQTHEIISNSTTISTPESMILPLSQLTYTNHHSNNSPDEGLGNSSCGSSYASSSFNGFNPAEPLSISIVPPTPLTASAPVVPQNFEDFELHSGPSSSTCSPNLAQKINQAKELDKNKQNILAPTDSTTNYQLKNLPSEEDLMSTSLLSSTTICSSQTASTSLLMPMVNNENREMTCIEDVQKFSNWNDLFHFLKKEITEIRAYDAQILENLKKIEEEISVVRHC